MSTPKPPTPKGGGPGMGPPPKWRTKDGVALETATGIAGIQTVGANFGTTGIIVATGVTAGAAGGGWALRQFAPGIASRIGLRKPGAPRPPAGRPGSGRTPGGRGISGRAFGSRPGGGRSGGRSGPGLFGGGRGRRPGTPSGSASSGRGRGGRRPGTSNGGGLTSRLRQRGNKKNNGYGRAPANSGTPTRKKARYNPKTGTWTTRSRNPFKRSNSPTGRGGRRPGTRNPGNTPRSRTRATGGGKNTPRRSGTKTRSWFKPGGNKGKGQNKNKQKTNGKGGFIGRIFGAPDSSKGTKPSKPRTAKPKPESPKSKPANPDKLTNATGSNPPGVRWQDITTGGTPMSGRSRIVRPGSGGGATGGSVSDPRFSAIVEAANAPIPEFDSAVELRGSMKSASAAADALGSFFGRYAAVAQESVRVNPAFSDAMSQTKEAMSLASEAIQEQQEAFDRLHSEQLEKIARGNKIDEAWDVGKNRNHM